jgi:GNAT superfamily N-acetyltransferase
VTARIPELSAPRARAPEYTVDEFKCGIDPLDDWLKRQDRHNEAEDGSRTFIVCADQSVVGYYSLAASSLLPGLATGRVRRNVPNPVPVVLIGRLAIDRGWQGKGLGGDLLRDATLRVLAAGDAIGVRGMLVSAISPEAGAFYERYGFKPSPIDPMTLMITLAEAKRAFAAPT